MDFFTPDLYFNLSTFKHADIFATAEPVWKVLSKIHDYLMEQALGNIEGSIETGAHLVNPELISIGKGTRVEAGAYIIGPCVIGENCQIRHGAYVRGDVLVGDQCVIGHATEAKNAIFMNKSQAGHFAYVGDSVLGNGVNLGAGTKCANLRFDRKPVLVGKERTDSGLKKFGAIFADGSQTGCNTVTNPGTIMEKRVLLLLVQAFRELFVLEKYKNAIEVKISEAIHKMGVKTPLRDACEYALRNGGKRFRPALVYLIAEGLGKENDISDAALAIELFHTASLIADDLPCMDDEETRRGQAALHVVYGEAVAILATYALIAEGYERIRLNAQKMENGGEIALLALENATKNTGICGATGGQYFDLFAPEQNLVEMIQKKTATLFEISFVFGWLFGGGEIGKLDIVKKASNHFGVAFQLYDDLMDIDEDAVEKNYAKKYGIEETKAKLLKELDLFEECMELLYMSDLHLSSMIKAKCKPLMS